MGKKLISIALIIGILAAVFILLLLVPSVVNAYPTGWTLQRRVVSDDAVSCDITAINSNVWVTWRSASTGSIWVRSSADLGATWGEPTCLDNGAFGNRNPVVVVGSETSQYVYVLFPGKRDGGGYFQTQVYRGTGMGSSWSRTWHSTGNSNKSSVDAARAANSGTVFMTFTNDSTGVEEVSWGKIGTNGTVTTGANRSAADGIDSSMPSIAANGYSDVMIVWCDAAGGSFSRNHLVESHSGDGGDTWTGGVIPDNDNDSAYRQSYPSIAWDTNQIVVTYQGQKTSDSTYFVGRYNCTPMGFNWSPDNTAASIYQSTGDVPCYPEVSGRFSADIFYKNATSQLSEHGVATNILGAKTLGSVPSVISVTSTDFEQDGAIDYVAAISTEGEVYLRRKDATGPAAAITAPVFNGANPAYFNANFSVECAGATDDFNVTGTDIQTGKQYDRGIESVTYTCTEDGSVWNPLECAGGTNVALDPPHGVTVDSNNYNRKRIKIKATSKDSAGNTTECLTPGWIYVDRDRPISSLCAQGTTGTNGFYRSNTTVTIGHSEYTFDHSEYKLENLDTGQKESNWTLYAGAFSLTEGHWKVYYRSYDKAGNVEALKMGLINIDKTPPVCSIMRPSKDTIQTGYYTDEAFRITGTGTDVNNLAWAAIYVDGQKAYETTSAFNMAYTWKLTGVSEGNHLIMVKARDRAGNVGQTTKTVFVGNVAKDWYFAEGNTLPEFDEWLCVLNPGDQPAKYQMSFMLDSGEVRTYERAMNPKQRDTVKVKDYIGDARAGVSVKIHSDNQAVVVERPMYFVYKNGVAGYSWKGGHNVMGINVLQKEWYFAEGTTRSNDPDQNNFEEWLTIQNPSDSQEAHVAVTYMLGTGQNVARTYSVAPHSRYTVEVAKDVGVNQDVSTRLVSDVPIAAERPMYFNYHGFAVDGSNVVGATGPSTSWSFAEGCTRPGFQEWLTIQNPNGVPASCKIK